MKNKKSTDQLIAKIDLLQSQLNEAQDTIEAIRTGQIDALVVNGHDGHALYTLKSADLAYRVFVEQMNEGALTLNAEGLIVYSNSNFSKMTGVPLSAVIGRPLLEFINLDEREYFNTIFNRGWQENSKGEITILSAGNTNIPVQVSLNVLQLDHEIVLSVIITDLSQQKKNERELKQKNELLKALNDALVSSNHDLQQFASIASHDLQEPLRKIQVFSKLLKDRAFNELSDSSKSYVDKIVKSAQRMKVLIVDILTYSKLSAKEQYTETLDLKALVDEIVEDFDLKISEKNATIRVGNLPVLEGNKGQLRQVFHNLLSNALKFTHPDKAPAVTIETKSLSAIDLGVSLENGRKYCRISVKDDGIGFDEKFASSIFSLFETLNPKTSFEGSGIGLAIAKKIIDKHHGLIIAKSIQGKGSEFNIILPIERHD
jgi:PAS domain S-box-containing protein